MARERFYTVEFDCGITWEYDEIIALNEEMKRTWAKYKSYPRGTVRSKSEYKKYIQLRTERNERIAYFSTFCGIPHPVITKDTGIPNNRLNKIRQRYYPGDYRHLSNEDR